MDFFFNFLICSPNKSIYLGQDFNELDKHVVKLKKCMKKQYIFFTMLKSGK